MAEPIPIPFPRPARTAQRRILSAQSIRGLKVPSSGRVDYFDRHTPSLSLRITSKNVRTWTVFYRTPRGQQKRFALGHYPAVTLADARDLAREVQRKVSRGVDPAVEKRAARDALTFGKLAQEYLTLHAKPHKRSWKEDERQLEVDLLPKWRHRAAADITRRDIRDLLDRKVAAGSPVAANRLRSLLSKIFNFAVEREAIQHNPVIGVPKPSKESSRERVLTEDEIRRIWNACETQNPYLCGWFRLRLATGQRGGELLQMRWRDIDDASGFWTIPAEWVKNNSGHRVHLNNTARRILGDLPRQKDSLWVFPRSLMGDYKHVARRLVQRSRANIVVGDRPAQPGKRTRADVRGHDLRRTAASIMASGGVPRFLIGRILNHSEERGVTGVYDRYSYDAEKKAAMEFWDRQLSAILDGKSTLVAGRFSM